MEVVIVCMLKILEWFQSHAISMKNQNCPQSVSCKKMAHHKALFLLMSQDGVIIGSYMDKHLFHVVCSDKTD